LASSKLPLRTRLAYGSGAIASAAKDNGFAYYLLMFYSQVLGLSPSLASLALFVAVCVEAIVDPLIGYYSDNLHSRWGRRHPLMYVSVLPAATGYYLLWNPPEHLSQSALFWYLLVLTVIVRTFFSLFRVPSEAMSAELTRDYDERTHLASYRHFFSWAIGVSLAYLVWKVFLTDTPDYPDGILNPHGWKAYGLTGSVCILAGILMMSLGTHRNIPSLPAPPPKRPFSWSEIAGYLRKTLGNRSFLSLFVASMMFAMAAGVATSLNIYFSRYYWALSQDQLWQFSPVNLLAAVGAFFLAPRIAARFDKNRVAIRLWLFAAIFLPVPVILKMLGWFPADGSDTLLNLLLVHSFIEITVMITGGIMISSMVADLVEDNEKATGRRSEGLLFSAVGLCAKCVTGLGIVLSGLILELVKFPVGAAYGTVPTGITDRFGAIAVGAMTLFYLLATFAMRFYRITRASHAEVLAGRISTSPAPSAQIAGRT
jgi:glycoside/pentoside/hexuronide:cation symporter, GPH family